MGNKFEDGIVGYEIYKVESEKIASLVDIEAFREGGGYIAFSNCEKRLNEIPHKDTSIKDLFVDRCDAIQGVEGFLMEIGLWRDNDGVFEEISIEREDHGFLFQRWTLAKSPDKVKGVECFFRNINTTVRSSRCSIFAEGELGTIEVICPGKRLHFFITTESGERH